jgi:uncharacterized protein YgiM (DUF1202 family)
MHTFSFLSLILLLVGCSPFAGRPTVTPAPTVTVPLVTAVPTRAHTATPPPTPIQPTPTPGPGTLPTNVILVRTNPGWLEQIVEQIRLDATFSAVGRTADNGWIQIASGDGTTGWIRAQDVQATLDFNVLAVTGEAEPVDFPGLALADTGLLDAPNGNTIGGLIGFAPIAITGRTAANDWVQIQTASEQTGWLPVNIVALEGTLNDVPVIEIAGGANPGGEGTTAEGATSVPATEPNAQVSASGGGVRLRRLPQSDGAIIINLQALTPLVVLGRSADNSWLRVEAPGAVRGWMSRSFVELLSVELESVPVVENPTPEPVS